MIFDGAADGIFQSQGDWMGPEGQLSDLTSK